MWTRGLKSGGETMKDGKISRLFGFLNSLPWTKPLAILTWGVNMLVFVGAWVLSTDIPANAKELGIYSVGVVLAAAAGQTVYEAV